MERTTEIRSWRCISCRYNEPEGCLLDSVEGVSCPEELQDEVQSDLEIMTDLREFILASENVGVDLRTIAEFYQSKGFDMRKLPPALADLILEYGAEEMRLGNFRIRD